VTRPTADGWADLPDDLAELAEGVIRAQGHNPDRLTFRVVIDDANKFSGGSARGTLMAGWSRPDITIILATDARDRVECLLHELAHVLRPHRDKHSAAFYDLLFALADEHGAPHGVTPDYVYERERRYMKRSIYAAARAGVREAAVEVRGFKGFRRAAATGALCRDADTFDVQRVHGADVQYHTPGNHRARLRPVEGEPVIHLGDVGFESYEALRIETCPACGWRGYVWRARLRYSHWLPRGIKM
jgi:hypothetical protein